ncbi:hypothetical protein ASE00_19305 [Sphingomonas sp. Root710]|uniref:YqaE/Pmp3 family membrane protein n=1 Tax=Sphingomonas sp. Root710 TaxID=1736594 RepID=UPI0006F634F4|nr:YqaE/Pmp3 family membrane protein [Sphingomonas sp. Root710]KRB79846.1 hypothetical protein ASE00_19305 [Sphingomonas sp. Root710]
MARQQISAAPISPWALVAAILLPPLGVFLARGITPAFWLTVVLTVIGWLPGVVLALVLLLIPERIPIR